MQWKDWMESCLTRPLGGSLDHDEALGGCLKLDEGFFGRLDKLLVIAALLPGPNAIDHGVKLHFQPHAI